LLLLLHLVPLGLQTASGKSLAQEVTPKLSCDAMKLARRYVEKPWGRTELPDIFESSSGKRIGEVWFTGAGDEPLLAKYLFTSERLSIQVHPNDEQAHERGLLSGKWECWYILDAEPDASIGLGLTREIPAEELRTAALDGTIEQLIGWRSVRPGDVFLVPPGTIHAIGGGISLLEFQQNADVTYRLYDYGRPRELHLDDGIAVARAEPYSPTLARQVAPEQFGNLVDEGPFALIYANTDVMRDRMRWVLPLKGSVRSEADSAAPGECLLVQPGDELEMRDARVLIGATALRT
jgi:mannose-6-phosphate isomerase